MLVPADVQSAGPEGCSGSPAYYPYTFSVHVTVTSSAIIGNTALLSGGGLSIGVGGLLTVSASTVVDNAASLFGAGILFGNLQSVSTCGVVLQGVNVSGNVATHGGSQLYSTCSAEATVINSTVMMVGAASQVREPPKAFALYQTASLYLCFAYTCMCATGVFCTSGECDVWGQPLYVPVVVSVSRLVRRAVRQRLIRDSCTDVAELYFFSTDSAIHAAV